MPLEPAFWRGRALTDLSHEEWEALCDGCGLCCLIKLMDEDTGDVAYTSVRCGLYDAGARCCSAYEMRAKLKPGCVRLTPETIDKVKAWMPKSCAYRRLAEGRDLPDWHPLISGTAASVAAAGVPVASAASEDDVRETDLQDYLVEVDI